METEGHGGEPVLVLTVVDVNENEETGKKSCVSSQIAAKSRSLEDNRSRVSPAAEGQPGKGGYVYAASNGRNVNTDTEHARAAGNPVMLDLVADRLPGSRLTDGCVIANLCNTEHRLNGFTESSVRLTVGLDTTGSSAPGGGGGVGGGGGTVSCTDTAVLARTREGNGMLLPPLDRVSGEEPEFNDGEPGEGAADSKPVLPSPVLSCTRKHRVNCTCACADVSDGKLSNGESDHGTDVDVSYRRLKGGSGVTEMKTANGGLHIVNTARATRDFETVQPENNKADVPFDAFEPEYGHELPNIRSSSPTYRESDSRAAPSRGDDGTGEAVIPAAGTQTPEKTGGEAPYPEISSDPSAKLHSPCPSTLSANTGDSHVTESGDFHGESTVTVPVRPLTLRTNPGIAVSLSCDATPLSPEDGDLFYGAAAGCVDIGTTGRRQSAPDKLPDGSTEGSNPADQRMLSKKFGIADFFTRSLFSRKPKEPRPPSQSAPGWRLFGKAPPPQRDNDPSKDSTTVQQEFQAKDGPQRPLSAGRRRNLDFEPLSTTALILEDRPANLPAKSEEEAQRHRQEYEEMVAGAKRRELKEAQRRKRQLQERIRQEESIANAMVTWNTEILPHWETTRGTRRVRELWWQGLPPSVRGRVWGLAIGNELNITPELYEIFLSRAKEKWRSYSETSSENETEDCGASLADRESSLDLIKLDISRTFPSLFIFQKGGPYHDLLHSVLGAYTCYRPDIGYVQGMSFIAAVLILNLEEADTFITFANLLNKPCQMAFFRVDHDLMLKYFAAFEVFFEENLPRLFHHFQTNSLTPDLYLIDWIFTLYSKSLPLDVACRVWDVFCRDGEESLFRTGLGILRLYQDALLQMDFIRMAQFLTRLPDDLAAHALFSCMAATHMLSGNRRWGQVFSALMKDGPKEVDRNNSPALRS